MSQEIPKDSQHAALHAIARLLSVPKDGLDVYNLLITVHATFGGRHAELEPDLKALVSGIYGHLGTVERNVRSFFVQSLQAIVLTLSMIIACYQSSKTGPSRLDIADVR